MRRSVEDPGDLPSQRVFQIQRSQAEQLVDGAGDRTHAGVLVRDRAGLDPGAGHQQNAAMRVHVVHAALGVVFGDKESRVLPDGGLRQEGHDAAQGQIVVGHVRGAVGIAVGRARIGGVVVGQTDHDQRRNLAGGEPPPEIALELRDPELVGDAEVEGGIAAVGRLEDRLEQRRVEEQSLPLRLAAVEISSLPSISRPSP